MTDAGDAGSAGGDSGRGDVADHWGPLARLRDHPGGAALLLDFDGTLAPIVADPEAARALPGTGSLLGALARRLGLVAVVSGRPVAFLAAALDQPAGVALLGLYGMERSLAGDGTAVTAPEAEQWRRGSRRGGPGHCRRAGGSPCGAQGSDGHAALARWPGQRRNGSPGSPMVPVSRGGLVPQEGRMAIELRPPVRMDKGTVVRASAQGHGTLAFFGDDLGDLPAFAELAALRREGKEAVAVAVTNAGAPQKWPPPPTCACPVRPRCSPSCVGWPAPEAIAGRGERARPSGTTSAARPRRRAGRSTSRRRGDRARSLARWRPGRPVPRPAWTVRDPAGRWQWR